MEFGLLISLPSAVGLYILSFPIIYILFERGAFVADDTFYTSKVLSIFALGLPAYILIKILVTCFFAREDTKTPLYISIASVIVNIILSILLIGSMREMGIALATAISSWANTILLFIILKSRKHINLDNRFIKHSIKIIFCGITMGTVCYFLNFNFFININDQSFVSNILAFLLTITVCIILYFSMIFMLKVLSIDELKGYIKK